MSSIHASIFAFLLSISGAAAQPPAASEVEQWFDRTWLAASTFDVPDGLTITWETVSSYFPVEADLERLRDEVKAVHQADPRVSTLKTFERRRKAGPDHLRQTLRHGSASRFRLSQDGGTTSLSDRFIECAQSGDSAWKLTPDWRVVLSSSKPWPYGHPLGWLRQNAMNETGWLLFGGFRLGGIRNLVPGRVVTDGDRWHSVATGRHGLRVRFEGRYDAEAGRGFQERVTIVSSDSFAPEIGTTWTIDAWHRDPDTGLWIAGSATEVAKDGRISDSWNLQSVTLEPSEAIDRATALPEFGGTDPIRGVLTFTESTDYRGDTPVESKLTPYGLLSAVKEIDPSLQWRQYLFRGIGIATSAVVVLVLALLRFRRRAPAPPSLSAAIPA